MDLVWWHGCYQTTMKRTASYIVCDKAPKWLYDQVVCEIAPPASVMKNAANDNMHWI